MKKFLKIFICALTFVMGFGVALANPTINIVNAISSTLASTPISVGNAKGSFAFDAVQMPSAVNAEEDAEKQDFLIPVPGVSDSDYTIGIVVKNSKNTFNFTVGGEDTAYFVKNGETGVYFKYNASSTYEVYYTATKDDVTFTSSIYEVKVTGVSYSFDSVKGNILPSIAGVSDKILIPAFSVVDSNDKEVENATITVDVIKNGAKLVASTNGELSESEGKMYLTPAEVGTYTIRYRSADYNLNADYEIVVREDFNSAKVDLQAETMTMKTCEVGKEATLPSPKVSDKAHDFIDKVETSTVITIEKNGVVVDTLDKNVFSYTFKEAGSYVVKYAISNFYLNNQKTLNVQIADEVVVEDTMAPEVKFVANYDTTVTDWEKKIEVLENYIVPTRVGYNGVTLPAIYAADLGTSYANLTFERVLEDNSGNTYYIDRPYHETNEPRGNASIAYDANYQADVTKSISFSFGKKTGETDEEFKTRVSGNYKLKYKATEKVGENEINRTGLKQVSIEILSVDASSYTDDTNLKFELPTMPSEMDSNETRYITVTNKATDDKDNAIETRFYYTYGSKEDVEYIFNSAKVEEKNYAYDFDTVVANNGLTDLIYPLNYANNKIKVKLKSETYTSQSKITVIGVAINDQGQCVVDAEEINIKDVTDDKEPVLKAVGSFDKSEYTLGVDSKINLPSVEFEDLSDKYLSVSVRYYIDDIKNGLSPVNGGYFSYDNNKLSAYAGAYIEPKQAGRYFVVYTAKDDANNSYDLTAYVDVVKQVNYSLHVESATSLDIYDSTEINAYVVDDEGNKCEKDYILLTSEPADWDSNYKAYFVKDAGKYVAVEDETVPTWEDDKYYEAKDVVISIRFTGTTPDCEGTTYTFNTAGDYTFIAKTNYAGKEIESGTRKIVVNNVKYVWDDEKNISVPTWSRLSPNSSEYSLTTSQPTNWATNFTNYYTKTDDKYNAVTGDTAPTWEADKFYKKNDVEFIQLTVPTASQNTKNRLADVKITNPSGQEVDYVDVVDANGVVTGDVKFIPDKEGKYTVTYTVDSLTKTFSIQVGDNNKPVVSFTDKTQIQKDIKYSNEDITYKLTYKLNSSLSNSEVNVYDVTIKAYTKEETISNYTVQLELYDLDKDSRKVALSWSDAIKNSAIKLNDKSSESSSEYIWTLSSVGNYTLKITATDTHGISSVAEVVKFKLVDESATKDKKDNKVGIILIVISAIVLVGIVCFFAFAGKTSKSKKSTAKKEVEVKEEENKND